MEFCEEKARDIIDLNVTLAVIMSFIVHHKSADINMNIRFIVSLKSNILHYSGMKKKMMKIFAFCWNAIIYLSKRKLVK